MECTNCETGTERRFCRCCAKHFCRPCFTLQHSVTTVVQICNGGWKQMFCSHHRQLLEYLCGQDGELTCAECLLVGDHKLHHPAPKQYWFTSYDLRGAAFYHMKKEHVQKVRRQQASGEDESAVDGACLAATEKADERQNQGVTVGNSSVSKVSVGPSREEKPFEDSTLSAKQATAAASNNKAAKKEIEVNKQQEMWGLNLFPVKSSEKLQPLKKVLTAVYGNTIAYMVHMAGSNTVRVIFNQQASYRQCLADRQLNFDGAKLRSEAFSKWEVQMYTSSVYVTGCSPVKEDSYFAQFGPVARVKSTSNRDKLNFAIVTFVCPQDMERALRANHPSPMKVSRYGRNWGGSQPRGTAVAAAEAQIKAATSDIAVTDLENGRRREDNRISELTVSPTIGCQNVKPY